jgi:hypothetical protein
MLFMNDGVVIRPTGACQINMYEGLEARISVVLELCPLEDGLDIVEVGQNSGVGRHPLV